MIISSFVNYVIKLTCKKVLRGERKRSAVRYSSLNIPNRRTKCEKLHMMLPTEKYIYFPILDYQALGSRRRFDFKLPDAANLLVQQLRGPSLLRNER